MKDNMQLVLKFNENDLYNNSTNVVNFSPQKIIIIGETKIVNALQSNVNLISEGLFGAMDGVVSLKKL